MQEIWKILLPVITVLLGAIVYALGHLLVALFVEPIHRLRSLIGEIADSLIFYAPIYSNPSGVINKAKSNEVSEILRGQASQLRARVQIIPWYSLWTFLGIVRQKKEIEDASRALIGLSNTVYSGPNTNYGLENDKKRKKIEELLGIRSSNKRGKKETVGSKYCLQQGILLFFFTLLVFGLFGLDKNNLGIPAWFIIGCISLIVTLIFMVAAVFKTWGDYIENFLEGIPNSTTQFIAQSAVRLIFIVVFVAGWLHSVQPIIDKGLWPSFRMVLWTVGSILFLIILIIYFRTIIKRSLRKN